MTRDKRICAPPLSDDDAHAPATHACSPINARLLPDIQARGGDGIKCAGGGGAPLFDAHRVNYDPARWMAEAAADAKARLIERNRMAAVEKKWLDTPIRYKQPSFSRQSEPRPGNVPRYVGDRYDHRQLHLSEFSTDQVQVFRVEISTPSKHFGHVFIENNERGTSVARLYVPGHVPGRPAFARDSEGRILRERKGRRIHRSGQCGPLDKSDPANYEKFVEQHRYDRGKKSWLNLGNPQRAAQFFDRSHTPRELSEGRQRSIKAFMIDKPMAQLVLRDCVHESLGKAYNDRPINVDRFEPNQFGLPPSYAKAIEAAQIPGTAREYTRDQLNYEIGTPFWTPDEGNTPFQTAGPTRINSTDWQRQRNVPFGRSLPAMREAGARISSSPLKVDRGDPLPSVAAVQARSARDRGR
jgi:hypothetical protein